jgi:tRNA-specific 2-thiouridylase
MGEVQFMAVMDSDRKKVVVAMSGGVDSSVAAALLVRAGHDVAGVMLRLWSDESVPAATDGAGNRCCTPDQVSDAEAVAHRLGIPFQVLDAGELFRETVVAEFVRVYGTGKTPNPCLVCNRDVRFGFLLKWARAAGADALATGHYVRIGREAGRYTLLQGVDDGKDQSYVLYMLGQAQLAHLLFPVGDYTKSEIRGLAEEFGLPVAAKAESQDICFLPDGDYRRFLLQVSPAAMATGPIVDQKGRRLGEHQGLPAYTIGQRKGLGISAQEPLYVVAMHAAERVLVVGPKHALDQSEVAVDDVRWVAGGAPHGPKPLAIRVGVRIRYRSEAVPATVTVENGRALVSFDRPQRGVSPGQAAVFYRGERCLGGGTISSEERLV